MAKSKRKTKIKVLDLLQTAKMKDENEFLSMTVADMVKAFPELTTEEFRILCDIQDSVREKRLFSYLCLED